MTFKKTEKEIIKAIVKYGGEVKSLVDVLNKSQLLEKRGIVIMPHDKQCYIFLHKDKFGDNDMDEKRGLGYVTELVSLIHLLIKERLIIIIPTSDCPSPVIGKRHAKKTAPEQISIDKGKEFISLRYRNVNWCDKDGNQIAWPVWLPLEALPVDKLLMPWFSVSQELIDLVNNNFKSEDEIRYRNQQVLTWISIILATIIGLLGIMV